MEYDFPGPAAETRDDDVGGGPILLPSLVVPLLIVPKYALLPENPLLTTGLDGDHFDIAYDFFDPVVMVVASWEDDAGGGGCE
jgi:hypothetical protein